MGILKDRLWTLMESEALTRIAHEIVEKNKGTEAVIMVGIKSRGTLGRPPGKLIERSKVFYPGY